MQVEELGELGLIELLAEIVTRSGRASGADLLVGIGDDAAVWRTEAGLLVDTTDTLVQGVHFVLDTLTWADLGWKALAVNISDIAAMGGKPRYALVSLGLPPDTEVGLVAELYRGLVEIAQRFGVDIAGGNVTSAPVVVVNISLVGTVDNILMRSAALPGDQIAVTGYLGSSAAGLRMLTEGLEFDLETAEYLREAHLRPQPRVVEGQTLARHGVRAAIDLSDGLIRDLGHILRASGVGAKLWTKRVPIHPLVRAALGKDSLGLALSGGEDYELLFTGSREVIDRVKGLMPTPVTVIGEVSGDQPKQVMIVDAEGKVMEWGEGGWEHFKRRRW